MDQRRMSKESNSFNQPTTLNQSLNQDSGYQRFSTEINYSSLSIEDDAKKTFKQSKKIISEIKSRNDQGPINIVTLEQFIMKSNLFFDSSFTNVLDKRILFAAFAMMHQYYLSSNYVPVFEHMLPFNSLWETFQKTFNFLDFNSYDSKIDEIIDQIKNIIDNGKGTVTDDNFTDDYDDIVATFSLLFQCFESIKASTSNSSDLIDQCNLAIDNAFKYISEAQSITSSSIQEIQVQLTILQQLLKSYQKTSNMHDCIDQINNLLSAIPSTFDSIKFNTNNCNYSDVTYLSKILKSVIDFYSIFFKLMVSVSDWKEARSLYISTQEIYTIIEQPFSTTLSNIDNSRKLKNFVEKVASLVRDRSLKDSQIIKDLNAVINILPPELVHVRSSFTNFSVKRREVLAEPSDSQKIFYVYQACINFASQLRPSNGPIYNLTYKLLQAYSRALINSIVNDNLETVINNFNIINLLNLSKNSKNTESFIYSEITKILKLSHDFASCGILSDNYKDFMNRFQIFIFYLKCLISNSMKMQPSTIARILPMALQSFPNFQFFKISKDWLNKDLNSIFKTKTEMVQSHISQFEIESGDSDRLNSIKNTRNSVFCAYGHYGQIIKDFDHDMIAQFNKYFRFKKCVEDFGNLLQNDANPNNRCELLVEPTEFSLLLENILEKVQTDKVIYDSNVVKICFDLSICLLYKDKANPETTNINYLNLLKIFTPPPFKQILQILLRYSELFVLIENENQTTGDNDDDEENANVAHNFGEFLVSFCSDQKEETFKILSSFYPSLKGAVPSFEFFGFESLFDAFKKFDSFISDVNRINSIYFNFPEYQKEFNTYDITIFYNMIESFTSSFEKFLHFKVISKESIENVQKILSFAKEINPIPLYSFLIYNNPEMERIGFFEFSEPQSEDKKTINLRQFIKIFTKMLTDLLQTIKFTDYQKIVKDELLIFSHLFSYYLNWCPEFKILTPQFDEFIELSNQIMTDFSPILFRILKVINSIFLTLKKSCSMELEVTALYQISQKIHSVIINALNIISVEKDLKVILNCFHNFSMKYQIEEEKLNSTYYPITDFFNYQKVNSSYVRQLFAALQDLYAFDLQISDTSEKLTFSEVYDVISPSLPIIDSLFDESTFYLVRNFFNEGCKKIDSSIKRLELTINSIDNKIKEERRLIKASRMNGSNNNNDDDDDEDATEFSDFSDTRGKMGISSILVDNQNDSQDSNNSDQPSKENVFESILNMYKNILDRKINNNKMLEKSIDELNAKVEEHKNEMNGINEEYMNYVQQLIPSEFDNYAKLILEPMKCFQSQETANSEKSEDSNADEDSQLDIFSGSEFNSNFVNTILMKIEELEQQNISLSRYINIQSFYSMVDEYIKSHKIQETDQTEKQENEKAEFPPNNNNNDGEFTTAITDVEPVANEGEKVDDDDEEEYEYDYEYVDDEDQKSEYEQFEQEEIKLIMMINSLRNSGKNKSTLKEIISSNFKESMSQIELDFYRLIEKSGELFNVEELANDHENDSEVFSNLLGSNQGSKYSSRKASDRKMNLIKLAQSLIQDAPLDDS